jgi:hypothetical protein
MGLFAASGDGIGSCKDGRWPQSATVDKASRAPSDVTSNIATTGPARVSHAMMALSQTTLRWLAARLSFPFHLLQSCAREACTYLCRQLLLEKSVSPRPESRPCRGSDVRYATVLRISGRAGRSQPAGITIGACKHGLRRRRSGVTEGSPWRLLCYAGVFAMIVCRVHVRVWLSGNGEGRSG